MNNNRPVNLDLGTVKFPITAIVSILHRVSGCVLLGGILVLIWMLDLSLSSEEGFIYLLQQLDQVWAKVVLWAVLAATAYHLVMGLRHLMMDLGFCETLQGGKTSAGVALVIAFILIALAGVWVW